MLQFIRDRAQGVIAWFIVILIIIPFALWGVHQYIGGGSEPAAATVNGNEISQARLQQAMAQQGQRLQEMFGAQFKPEMFPEEMLKRETLKALVTNELMVQAAAGSGMRVSDQYLGQTIHDFEPFQDESGAFSPEAYKRWLLQQGMSAGYFEQQLRRDMLVSQLQGGVRDSDFVTPAELASMQRLQSQKRDLGYMVLSLTKAEEQAEVDDAGIQAYYEENAARFMEPERVVVEYLELKLADLAKAVKVSDEELKQRYEAQQDNYRTPEERRARHILVRGDDAEKRIAELKVKLDAGSDFAELAREYSEDTGSAAQGGDLDYFGRGIMDPAFEAAAFALKPGEVSEPVESSFGWHLIKLEDLRGGELVPFAEVKEQIRSDIQRSVAEEQYYATAEQLANLTYEQPDSLEPAARALDMSIQRSPAFSRDAGPGIAADAKVRTAAFSDETLKEGLNSEALELADDHMLVLRVAEHLPASQKPLVTVRAQIEKLLKRQQAENALDSLAAEVKEQLVGGAEAAELARKQGSEWRRVGELARDDRDNPAAVTRKAFSMPRSDTRPSVDTTALTNGDRAVVMLYGVHEGEAADADETLAKRLRGAQREAAMAGLTESLHRHAEISLK